MPAPIPRLFANPTAALRLLSKLPARRSTGGHPMSSLPTPDAECCHCCCKKYCPCRAQKAHPPAAAATKGRSPGFVPFSDRLAVVNLGAVVGVLLVTSIIGGPIVSEAERQRLASSKLMY